MTSRAILDSKYFDDLLVNNLHVQNNLKVLGNTVTSESFLFSIHFYDSSISSPLTIAEDNTLTLKTDLLNSTNANIIKFADRPFRDVKNISFTDLITLFSPGSSFYKDPPNVVIVSSNSQAVFIMTLDDTSSNFTFVPNPNNNPNLDDFINNSSFSIFIDTINWQTSDYTVISTGALNVIDPSEIGEFNWLSDL